MAQQWGEGEYIRPSTGNEKQNKDWSSHGFYDGQYYEGQNYRDERNQFGDMRYQHPPTTRNGNLDSEERRNVSPDQSGSNPWAVPGQQRNLEESSRVPLNNKARAWSDMSQGSQNQNNTLRQNPNRGREGSYSQEIPNARRSIEYERKEQYFNSAQRTYPGGESSYRGYGYRDPGATPGFGNPGATTGFGDPYYGGTGSAYPGLGIPFGYPNMGPLPGLYSPW